MCAENYGGIRACAVWVVIAVCDHRGAAASRKDREAEKGARHAAVTRGTARVSMLHGRDKLHAPTRSLVQLSDRPLAVGLTANAAVTVPRRRLRTPARQGRGKTHEREHHQDL
jgi:hypothetical protein